MLAFGFNNLIIDDTCADVYNAKTISAANDSIFKINIYRDKNQKWLEENKANLPIYVANAHKGKDIKQFKPADKFCLVLGSEAHGVDNKIIDLATENIKIKISDNIESLNVAIATAIFLYEFKK